MSPAELNNFCRALDLHWPATLEQLDEAKRLQSQVWHPDRHHNNEKLRLRGEEKLKRVNEAYKRLREYLLEGAAPTCPDCGSAMAREGMRCEACQRNVELARRERELRRRERELEDREAARRREREIAEREAARPRFVDIAGRWAGGMGVWMQFFGSGPEYEYVGGGLLGQTESGTATVSGNSVALRAHNALFGPFTATFTVLGARMQGFMQGAIGSGAVEVWRA